MSLLDEKIYGNALNLIPTLGPVSLTKLYNYFGSFVKAWNAVEDDYLNAGLAPKAIREIIANKQKINPEQSFAELTRRQIEIILITEKNYPILLKEIQPAPPLLYIRGQKDVLNTASIAIVGTRKMSTYGANACEEISSGLAQNGITVVSGLAFGVDAIAHNSALSNAGRTIAVLASDLDNFSISPRSNFNLAQKIMETGALISEYPLGIGVQK